MTQDRSEAAEHEVEPRPRPAVETARGPQDEAALAEHVTALVSQGTPCALLVVTLARFKEIVDSFGHEQGERVVEQVSRRLRLVLRESEYLYRLEEGEFAVVVPDERPGSAQSLARKIDAAVRVPVVLDDVRLALWTTIGIAHSPADGIEPEELLRHAAVAMHSAQRSGNYLAAYDRRADPYRTERLSLIGDLRDAIRDGLLSLHFQPKVRLSDGAIPGVEALARWEHPVRGSIPPSEFIALAEETGLIEPLTRWVIRQALQQCKELHEAGQPLSMAVNLAPRNLLEADLVDTVRHALSLTGLPETTLKLEVTESVLVEDPEGALMMLYRLSQMGVRIGIDDFGIGYSSLGYLRRLPIDSIKIDRTFVMHMDDNQSDAAIVRAVIDLAHNLGLEVVAEGVETQAAWDMLQAWRCDLVQGYFISRPLPAEEIKRWLEFRPSGA